MQRRDIGSEIVVAIAVIAVLAFALAFGILLSLSSNSGVIPTPTDMAIVDVSTNTAEAILPTVTAAQETAEWSVETTPVPPEFTDTSSPTSIPPTETSTTEISVSTPTQESSPTLTRTLISPTSTVIEATDTPTRPQPTLTVTSSPTSTYTATPTRTASRTPTNSATLTPSATATRTPTPTLTRTPTATPTNTPQPTETSGIRPTLTFTPTVTGTVTLESESCFRPEGWQNYVVQPGNTLFSIGQAVGSSVRELSRVNCIVNADRIVTGDILYVPKLPSEPVRTNVIPTNVPGQGGSRTVVSLLGCADPNVATMTNLYAGQRLSSAITLRGTATVEDFSFYKMEVRPAFADVYNFYFSSNVAVERGELGTLDPKVFGTGLHWVRLVVVKADASVPPEAVCVVPVQFE
jgi:hypothetical protein